jgi:hypothetical protein
MMFWTPVFELACTMMLMLLPLMIASICTF